jgi:hypothetical protein
VSAHKYAPEADEARWNYAYWLRAIPVEIGGPSDPTGLALGQEWIKQAGLRPHRSHRVDNSVMRLVISL